MGALAVLSFIVSFGQSQSYRMPILSRVFQAQLDARSSVRFASKAQRVSYPSKSDAIRNTSIGAGFSDVRNLTLARDALHFRFVCCQKKRGYVWARFQESRRAYRSQNFASETFCTRLPHPRVAASSTNSLRSGLCRNVRWRTYAALVTYVGAPSEPQFLISVLRGAGP